MEHRRAPASPPRRQALARRLALLGPRLRERALRRHDPRGLHRAAGALRRGRGAPPHRGRALHRLLRHAQHGARAGAPPRAARARHLLAARRCDAGLAGADQAPHRPRRERDLQHLRTDRDLRQLQRHRRGRPAGETPQHGGTGAAGHRAPYRRSRNPGAAACRLRGRDPRPGLRHGGLLQGPRAGRAGVSRRLVPHRRPRAAGRGGLPPLPRAAQGDDQDRRHQRLAGGGGGGVGRGGGGRARLRHRPAGPGARPAGRRRHRAAGRRHAHGRGPRCPLRRAPRCLQGAEGIPLRRRRRPASHHHRQAAEGPARRILRLQDEA